MTNLPPTHVPSYSGPPLISFPASQLQSRLNTTEHGKYRKPPIKDLARDCPELLELVQHMCVVEGKYTRNAHVVCRPVQRLFRRCAKGLMVETTEWEGLREIGALSNK